MLDFGGLKTEECIGILDSALELSDAVPPLPAKTSAIQRRAVAGLGSLTAIAGGRQMRSNSSLSRMTSTLPRFATSSWVISAEGRTLMAVWWASSWKMASDARLRGSLAHPNAMSRPAPCSRSSRQEYPRCRFGADTAQGSSGCHTGRTGPVDDSHKIDKGSLQGGGVGRPTATRRLLPQYVIRYSYFLPQHSRLGGSTAAGPVSCSSTTQLKLFLTHSNNDLPACAGLCDPACYPRCQYHWCKYYQRSGELCLLPNSSRSSVDKCVLQLWNLYSKLPLSSSQDIADQIRLRRDVVRLKREMAGISAQDEFSRWAKLRRQHDKAEEAYNKKGRLAHCPSHYPYSWNLGSLTGSYSTAEIVKSTRASFDSRANIARWGATSGLRFFLQFWHSTTPIFTIPKGWVPWYVEWTLAFPRAPSGSISINVWSAACATVFALLSDMAAYALLQFQAQRQDGTGKRREQPFGTGTARGEKKEL